MQSAPKSAAHPVREQAERAAAVLWNQGRAPAPSVLALGWRGSVRAAASGGAHVGALLVVARQSRLPRPGGTRSGQDRRGAHAVRDGAKSCVSVFPHRNQRALLSRHCAARHGCGAGAASSARLTSIPVGSTAVRTPDVSGRAPVASAAARMSQRAATATGKSTPPSGHVARWACRASPGPVRGVHGRWDRLRAKRLAVERD